MQHWNILSTFLHEISEGWVQLEEDSSLAQIEAAASFFCSMAALLVATLLSLDLVTTFADATPDSQPSVNGPSGLQRRKNSMCDYECSSHFDGS